MNGCCRVEVKQCCRVAVLQFCGSVLTAAPQHFFSFDGSTLLKGLP